MVVLKVTISEFLMVRRSALLTERYSVKLLVLETVELMALEMVAPKDQNEDGKKVT